MSSTAPPPPTVGCGEPTGPVAALVEATRLVDEAAETMWAARSGSELTAVIESAARLRAKLDGLELAVVGAGVGAVGQAAMKDAGWASVKDYLTHTNGARKGAGPATVRLARALEQFPALAEALAAGEISRVKAQIIAAAVDKLPVDRQVRDQALSLLLEQAQQLSADDLDRAGRHILEVVDPQGVDARLERELERTERAAHRNRSLNFRFDRLGGGGGRFHGSAEDVLLLKTALMALAAPSPPSPAPAAATPRAPAASAKPPATPGATPAATAPGCSTP